MAGGYTTGAGQSPRRGQIAHPVRRSVIAPKRPVSRDGTARRMMVTSLLSKTRAEAAECRNLLHFLADSGAVCAANNAISNTVSAFGTGSIDFPLTGEINHGEKQAQHLVFAALMNSRKARSPYSANPAPYMVYPVWAVSECRALLGRGGVPAHPDGPSEVVRRNAFQRLAGRFVVFPRRVFSSFHMSDSGGQKVRPDFHVVASSLAVSAGPVGPFVVFTQ